MHQNRPIHELCHRQTRQTYNSDCIFFRYGLFFYGLCRQITAKQHMTRNNTKKKLTTQLFDLLYPHLSLHIDILMTTMVAKCKL